MPVLGGKGRNQLMVVWGQGTTAPTDPLKPVRHRLFATHSEDGGEIWTSPTELLPDLPEGVSMGLPRLTGDGTGWWLLTYLSDDIATAVVLLRSDDDGRLFRQTHTLARRQLPVDTIYLHGGYLQRYSKEFVQLGDYAGLAAHGNRVVAAFPFTESDDPAATVAVYVSVIDEP